jgi:N-acetylglucosamine kinase-like BadF-type ATPase
VYLIEEEGEQAQNSITSSSSTCSSTSAGRVLGVGRGGATNVNSVGREVAMQNLKDALMNALDEAKQTTKRGQNHT